MSQAKHPFHLVPLSPWPISISFALLFLVSSIVMFLHSISYSEVCLIFSAVSVSYCAFKWWQDVIHEGKNKHHTSAVKMGLKIGMGLFILSEIILFASFFSSFFKAQLDPIGILEDEWVVGDGIWAHNVEFINPWNLPFINTLILLLSGTTITWAHYSLLENNTKAVRQGLAATILLGITFTILQLIEYSHAAFKISDGIYPSNFYLITAFHGVHVIVGTIFLIICYFRAVKKDFDHPYAHLGFEFAAWYWHFVDVIWLLLFIFVYILGRY